MYFVTHLEMTTSKLAVSKDFVLNEYALLIHELYLVNSKYMCCKLISKMFN